MNDGSNTSQSTHPVTQEVINRAAHQLIKRYGKEAARQAAIRSNSALEVGDEFNHDLWLRVAMAVVAVHYPVEEREVIYSAEPKDFSEAEVWAAARLILEYFPKHGSLLAGQRADGALEEGDGEGFGAWLRISRAIEELERTKPGEGEALN